MTSFDTLATSTANSRPLEIYEITLGNVTYRYTSAEDTLTVDGEDYAPRAISRTNISMSGEAATRPITLTLPSTDALVSNYKSATPGVKASVLIYRLERDESPTFNTRRLKFKGQIKSVRFVQDGYTAEIAVASIEDALNRNMPLYTYMSMCNHVLYGSRCGVNAASFDLIGAVSSGGATEVITVVGADGQADGYWTGGYVATVTGASDFRLIIAHSGTDLTLLLPFSRDVTSENVQVFAGCDHLATGDCATKFDNVLRFGGFHVVPDRNPFTDEVF